MAKKKKRKKRLGKSGDSSLEASDSGDVSPPSNTGESGTTAATSGGNDATAIPHVTADETYESEATRATLPDAICPIDGCYDLSPDVDAHIPPWTIPSWRLRQMTCCACFPSCRTRDDRRLLYDWSRQREQARLEEREQSGQPKRKASTRSTKGPLPQHSEASEAQAYSGQGTAI